MICETGAEKIKGKHNVGQGKHNQSATQLSASGKQPAACSLQPAASGLWRRNQVFGVWRSAFGLRPSASAKPASGVRLRPPTSRTAPVSNYYYYYY